MFLKTLLKFNDLLDLTPFGDYEAHTVDGMLTANIAHFTNGGLIELSLKEDNDIHMYTSVGILKKYLDLFKGDTINMSTNDECMLIWDDDLEVVVPLVDKETASSNTKKLKKIPDYTDSFEFKISSEDMKHIVNITSKMEELIVKFELSSNLKIKVKNVTKKFPAIVGEKPKDWYFSLELLKALTKHASVDIKFNLHYDDNIPSLITYTSGPLHVKAYIMISKVNDD